MPGTNEELVALANAASQPPEGATWNDGTAITPEERETARQLGIYLATLRVAEVRRQHRGVQRRAYALLKTLLTPSQCAALARGGAFVVTTAAGRSYRILPRLGMVERVTRHGRRWFVLFRYCIHDERDDGMLPPADLSVAHLLMLLADEDEFLRTANATFVRDQLWNGAYLRHIRSRAAEVMAVTGDR